MSIRRAFAFLLAGGALVLSPSLAEADITAFLGSLRTAAPQTVKGIAVGGTLIVVGVELEYANSSEDVASATPGLTTGMASAIVRTPTGRIQAYATAGAGIYRQSLAGATNTNAVLCIGGGVIVGLSGPFGVRVDYRVLSLRNAINTDTATPKRIYAGVNFKF